MPRALFFGCAHGAAPVRPGLSTLPPARIRSGRSLRPRRPDAAAAFASRPAALRLAPQGPLRATPTPTPQPPTPLPRAVAAAPMVAKPPLPRSSQRDAETGVTTLLNTHPCVHGVCMYVCGVHGALSTAWLGLSHHALSPASTSLAGSSLISLTLSWACPKTLLGIGFLGSPQNPFPILLPCAAFAVIWHEMTSVSYPSVGS